MVFFCALGIDCFWRPGLRLAGFLWKMLGITLFLPFIKVLRSVDTNEGTNSIR